MIGTTTMWHMWNAHSTCQVLDDDAMDVVAQHRFENEIDETYGADMQSTTDVRRPRREQQRRSAQ